jgi:deoxyribonuclease V
VFDFKKAKEAQIRLSSRLELKWKGGQIRYVAGADCSYDRRRERIGAAVVVLEMPGFRITDVSFSIQTPPIPYVPGFLNYREGPSCLRAFKNLNIRPDVLLVDGNGIAHPRRMGLASFLGIVLGISTIGCAKSAFFPWDPPPPEKGSSSAYLNRQKEKVGEVLRTRTNVKPVFVSPGHKVDFETARYCVLESAVFRIPESLRRAHLLARRLF